MTLYSPVAQRLKVAGCALSVLVALVGCARVNDMGKRLMASSMKAVAVVNETLLVGDVTLIMDRTGRLSLASSSSPGLSCQGEMRYTATRTGIVNLRCSDGTDTRLEFGALSEISGYGSGSNAGGPVSLAFGMDVQDAVPYLTLPAGQRVVSSYGHAHLEPINSPGLTP